MLVYIYFIDFYYKNLKQMRRPNQRSQSVHFTSQLNNNYYRPQTNFADHTQLIKPLALTQQTFPRSHNTFEIDNDNNIDIFLKSQMKFRFQQIITYEKLLNQYDRILNFDLQDQRLLMHQVLIMEIQMQPQDMFWINWKNSDQILEFLQQMQTEVANIMSFQQRKLKTGAQIVKRFHYLLQNWTIMNQKQSNGFYGTMDQSLVDNFIGWMNLVGQNPYLRKNTDFLIFIGHCLPIDKWNMLIYNQLYVKKPFGIVEKVKDFFSDKKVRRRRQYFLTITSDGILKSDAHLLLSRVKSMIPFTNLMKIRQQRQGDDIVYHIYSGRSESLKINFSDDYVQAINFACGLGRARIDAYYKAPYKALTGEKSYLRQDYIRQEKLNTQYHRFSSFAPLRTKCSVKLYNDGCGYFQDVYACMMNAKYQICITDWMLTPSFLLRRPGSIKNQNIENRLDGVLGQAADRGVKIFIILFMQPAMFMQNDSEGAAKSLQKMHKNIKVLRHPNVAVPTMWSHHQKSCVIDQKVGFMGGLDICYGRWDTPQHRLVENETDPNRRLWDGCDYNNFRTKDIYEPRQYQTSNLNQDFQVRMPWHDISLQMRGDSVIDLLRHFVQYWYFVKGEYRLSPKKFFSSFKTIDGGMRKRDIGRQIKETTQDFFQEKWQLLKEDVAQQFFPGRQQRVSQLLIEQRTGMNEGQTNIQMLRSASNWSIGADPDHPQRSIHEAYKDLIKNSESHIYIQNQFFMGLKNQIAKTLCERIIKAWNEKKTFKAIIVVPLLPGFEGDPGDQDSKVLRIQIHWQKVAISTGNDSIYSTLQRNCPGIHIPDYLFFFGLRAHDFLRGSPITEIIYVHSKLMIVDDKRGICGSANINDRSLWGTGDSQLAICIQQSQKSRRELFDLRCRVCQQHFAVTPQQCREITTPKVWNMLLQRAKTNTLIYRQVFGCIPDDLVTTHQQIDILASHATYNTSKLRGIRGHAVQYPLDFMNDQDLQFSIGQKQYYAPVESYT